MITSDWIHRWRRYIYSASSTPPRLCTWESSIMSISLLLGFFNVTYRPPLVVENPFLTCTCRGILRGQGTSPMAHIWRDHLSQKDVDRVRERLLFCRCHMRESYADQSGLYRICLLSHMLSLADAAPGHHLSVSWHNIK